MNNSPKGNTNTERSAIVLTRDGHTGNLTDASLVSRESGKVIRQVPSYELDTLAHVNTKSLHGRRLLEHRLNGASAPISSDTLAPNETRYTFYGHPALEVREHEFVEPDLGAPLSVGSTRAFSGNFPKSMGQDLSSADSALVPLRNRNGRTTYAVKKS